MVHYIESSRDTGWVAHVIKYQVTFDDITHPLPPCWRRDWCVHVKRFPCPCASLDDRRFVLCERTSDQRCHFNLHWPFFITGQALRKDPALAEVPGDDIRQARFAVLEKG